jgi:hypothetical protein
MKRSLGFSGLTRRTSAFSRLLRHTRGSGGSFPRGGLFLYLGIHRRTAGMGHLFDQSNILMGCYCHQSVTSMGRSCCLPLYQWVVNLSLVFITLFTLLWNIWLGKDFQRKYIWMGMVFKNIEYMNGGVLKISASVPKCTGRAPGIFSNPDSYEYQDVCLAREKFFPAHIN